MGKDRDKQRTKGNVKPSSSGRAAALVTRDGSMGFVGFGGQGASNLGYVPLTASACDDGDASVDADFRLVMRKLTKRDAVTKLKAVQEFCELCKTSSPEAVEGVLPYWPRLFNKLAMDVDHRVREATQEAMMQLVERVGRNLAPHLKFVVSIWLCAQFDTYAPVASAAQKSFHAAFTAEKQTNAIIFCRDVIFEFVKDNLLNQTPTTLSDPKFVPEEERDSKYNRVVSSSLLVLAQLISTCTEDLNAEMETNYTEIMEQKKFWKFARHKSVHVRASMFSLITTCCQMIPTVLQSLSSQVCPVVLSSLDETEPVVCPQLWDAVLSVLQSIPDCWQQVNIRKAVLPKLWVLLKKGGNGCASAIYPSLLPFISNLPDKIMGLGFYREFFPSMHSGLSAERVISSPTERAVVMTTYMECLRYCLLQSKGDEEQATCAREYLIKEQVLPVVLESLQPGSKLSTAHLYPALADLLSHLSKTDVTMETHLSKTDVTMEMNEAQGEEKPAATVSDALKWFWEGFGLMCMALVEQSGSEKLNTAMVNALSNCLLYLKSSDQPGNTKQTKQRVAFTDSTSNQSTKDETAVNGVTSGLVSSFYNSNVENLYNGELLNLVCKICKSCTEGQDQRCRSESHLRLLSSLFPEFICTNLLEELLERERLTENKEQRRLCEDFLDSVVFPWIKDCNTKADLDCTVELFFGVLRTYSEHEQVESLRKIIKIKESAAFFSVLLQKGVTRRISGVFTWLQSEQGCNKVESLLQQLAQSVREEQLATKERDSIWSALQLCLVPDNQAPYVNRTCVDLILEKFVEMLRPSYMCKSHDLDMILEILRKYFMFCESNTAELSAVMEDILLAVFLLQFTEQSHLATADDVWRSGLRASCAVGSGVDILLVHSAAIITDRLKTAQDVDSVVGLAELAVKLLQEVHSLSKMNESMMSSVRKILYSFVPDQLKCRELRKGSLLVTWQAVPMLYTNLPITTDMPEMRHSQDVITLHHKSVMFAALLMRKILTGPEWTADFGLIVKDEEIEVVLLEAVWLECWCMCVVGCRDINAKNCRTSALASKYPAISNLLSHLTILTEDLLKIATEGTHSTPEHLHTIAMMMSNQEGLIWALVLRRLVTGNIDCDVASGIQVAVLQAMTQGLSGTMPDNNLPMPLTASECQTLVSLMPYVDDIYTVKVVTEATMRWIGEEQNTEGYALAYSLLATSLSRWSAIVAEGMTEDRSGKCVTDGIDVRQVEFQLTLQEALDTWLEWKMKHDRILLLNADMADVTPAEVTANTAIMRIIDLAIREIPEQMKSDHWDSILCGLAAWLQTCEENISCLGSSLLWTLLCYHACSLHSTLASFFAENHDKLQEQNASPMGAGMARMPSPQEEVPAGVVTLQGEGPDVVALPSETTGFPPNLLTEWEEFFSGSVFNAVMMLFLHTADHISHDTMDVQFNCLMRGLGEAVVNTPVSILQGYKFNIVKVPRSDDALPPWAQGLLQCCLGLLEADVPLMQITGYFMLLKAMPNLAMCYEGKPPTDEQEETARSPPLQLMATIEKSLSRIEALLQDAMVRFGEHLSLSDDLEAQNTVLTTTLLGKLLIAFFRYTTAERRVEYAHFLRKSRLISKLLSMLFHIMPLERTTAVSDDFELRCDDDVTEVSTQDLARSLYFSLLHWMPAMARQWFNGLEKKHATIVDRYTSSSVTQLLCQREMQQVQNSSTRFDNMHVKTRPCAGEVAAVYTVDEISMELVVKLANNHPLGVVMVESGKKIGVTMAQWRSWMLRMTTFLTHQNGSIMDGLILWKRNADKHFEGVEDCMICFSVIHVSNYSLPKLSCKTCKKKFHSICIYRWFSTSNNSTCPLCRNIF